AGHKAADRNAKKARKLKQRKDMIPPDECGVTILARLPGAKAANRFRTRIQARIKPLIGAAAALSGNIAPSSAALGTAIWSASTDLNKARKSVRAGWSRPSLRFSGFRPSHSAL